MESSPPAATSDLRVVVFNQYYLPDIASTGHRLHELAEELVSRGGQVSVITSRPSCSARETWQPCARREFTNGVNLTWLIKTSLSRDHLFGRVVNSVRFLSSLMQRVLSRRDRGEVVLHATNPADLGMIGAFVSMTRPGSPICRDGGSAPVRISRISIIPVPHRRSGEQ